jgi:hypothetical protein
MAEENAIRYSIGYEEVAKFLFQKHGLHEGIWGIYIVFKMAAINAIGPDKSVSPAAVLGIQEMGIAPAQLQVESTIAFDAARLNPKKLRKGKKSQA